MSATPTTQSSVVIVGGGIGGLSLALALHHKLGVTPTVYEQAPSFTDDVGGAIGMYPNGLRVIRDISPAILQRIRDASTPFKYRRWMRHDGTEVAVGAESRLCKFEDQKEEQQLSSIGIRRWRLQKILYQACVETNIPVVFNERVARVENTDASINTQGTDTIAGKVNLLFESGKRVTADLVFGCDGVRSAVRSSLFGQESEPKYTGITCLMGAADIPRPKPGICFPSSSTTRCHAVYYPTGTHEQIFQIYFPIMPERPETWKTLTEAEGKAECQNLAAKLKKDGWTEEFLEPLLKARSVIRVGLRARDPIPRWHKGRVILLGDAAHPPVPYIGQGAMMALEDLGILTHLLKRICTTEKGGFVLDNLGTAVKIYEQLRIPRTTLIYRSSHQLGDMQLLRANNPSFLETKMEE